jgi:hypothetical protein
VATFSATLDGDGAIVTTDPNAWASVFEEEFSTEFE